MRKKKERKKHAISVRLHMLWKQQNTYLRDIRTIIRSLTKAYLDNETGTKI
jgi:hypothetical protein